MPSALVGVAPSVGLLLPVLISAGSVSTSAHQKHVEWSHVRRLLPFLHGSDRGICLLFFRVNPEPKSSKCPLEEFFSHDHDPFYQ